MFFSATIQLLVLLLPRIIRFFLLRRLLGWRIDGSARVGLAFILVRTVALEAGARIGNLTLIKGLDRLTMGARSSIGNWNWVYAYPSYRKDNFVCQGLRDTGLSLGTAAHITSRHIVDCSESVEIGDYSVVAGYHSQLITHSVDMLSAEQMARPIKIGSFCFIGSRCILMGGVTVGDRVVVGAGAVLPAGTYQSDKLFAGVPAVEKKSIPPGAYKYHIHAVRDGIDSRS